MSQQSIDIMIDMLDSDEKIFTTFHPFEPADGCWRGGEDVSAAAKCTWHPMALAGKGRAGKLLQLKYTSWDAEVMMMEENKVYHVWLSVYSSATWPACPASLHFIEKFMTMLWELKRILDPHQDLNPIRTSLPLAHPSTVFRCQWHSETTFTQTWRETNLSATNGSSESVYFELSCVFSKAHMLCMMMLRCCCSIFKLAINTKEHAAGTNGNAVNVAVRVCTHQGTHQLGC